MGKNILAEDIQKMMGLINYDRSKTLTENKDRFKKTAKRIVEDIDYGDDDAAEDSGWIKPCEDIEGWGKPECKEYIETEYADWMAATGVELAKLSSAGVTDTTGKIAGRAGVKPGSFDYLNGILTELERATEKTGAFVKSKINSRDKSWAESEITREGSTTDTGWIDTMEGGGAYDTAFGKQVKGPTSRYEFTIVGKTFGKRESYYGGGAQDLYNWIDGEYDLVWADDYDANVTNVDIIYDGKEYGNFAEFIKERVDKHFTIEFNNCIKATKKCEGTTADSDVDFDKLKINEKAFPWQYNIDVDTEVKTAYEGLSSNKKYTDKYSPEFLWANAYYGVYKDKDEDPNLGWTEEFYIEWPGDGKRVVETETVSESRTKRNRRGYGFITEGGIGKKKNKDGSYSKEENRAPGGGDEDEGGAQSTQQTKCTFDQILAGKCEAKKGQKGTVIGEIQEKLKSSGVEGTGLPKHGADKDFGSETEGAVKAFQTANNLTPSGIVNSETAKALQTGGQPTIPENQVAAAEQNLTDAEKVKAATTALQQKIAGQPTKDQCIELIGTASAGLKYGLQDSDKFALGHCFNTYNFIGKGGNKVKKAYNLKGKGNPTK
jgi:peptidoglycan hydrolase-like protein with peptidoglycan-binding domain